MLAATEADRTQAGNSPCSIEQPALPLTQQATTARRVAGQRASQSAQSQLATEVWGHWANDAGAEHAPGAGTAAAEAPELTRKNSTPFVQGDRDGDSVDVNDLSQGNLWDCFLLGAAGAVAMQRPDLIRNMIATQYDANGDPVSYTVTFKRRVEQRYEDVSVTIGAESFPNKNRAHPSGDSNAKGQAEIWPLIIEGAFAKLIGGYDKFKKIPSTGLAEEALSMSLFSGQEGQKIPVGEVTSQSMADAISQGKGVVMTTIRGNGQKTGNLPFELHRDHTYILAGVFGNMLKLINPWGKDHPDPVSVDKVPTCFSAVYVNPLGPAKPDAAHTDT